MVKYSYLRNRLKRFLVFFLLTTSSFRTNTHFTVKYKRKTHVIMKSLLFFRWNRKIHINGAFNFHVINCTKKIVVGCVGFSRQTIAFAIILKWIILFPFWSVLIFNPITSASYYVSYTVSSFYFTKFYKQF